MATEDDLPESSGAPHPIVAYVAELEAALVHMWEFMPRSSCSECQRIKDFTYALIVKRAKELDGRGTVHHA